MKLIFIGTVLAFIALFTLLQVTTPATIGPAGILLIFVLMYLSILGFLVTLFTNYTHISVWFSQWRTRRTQNDQKAMQYVKTPSLERSYYYASILALAPVMLVGMASIDSISLLDIGLVVIFVLMGCLYVTRRIGLH